jgi:hypothetical protein
MQCSKYQFNDGGTMQFMQRFKESDSRIAATGQESEMQAGSDFFIELRFSSIRHNRNTFCNFSMFPRRQTSCTIRASAL